MAEILLTVCLGTATSIMKMAEMVKFQKKQCHFLSELVQDITMPLGKLKDRATEGELDESAEQIIERLAVILEEAENLIMECKQTGRVKGFLVSGNYKERFDNLEKKLLMMTLPATLVATNESVHQGQLNQDTLEEIKEHMKRVETIQRENTMPMSFGDDEDDDDDIANRRVTIDFTDREELIDQLFPSMDGVTQQVLVSMIPNHMFTIKDDPEEEDNDDGDDSNEDTEENKQELTALEKRRQVMKKLFAWKSQKHDDSEEEEEEEEQEEEETEEEKRKRVMKKLSLWGAKREPDNEIETSHM